MIPAIALLSSLVQLAPSVAKMFGASKDSQEIAETAATVARTVTGTSSNDDALTALKANPEKVLEFERMLQEAAAVQFAAELQDKKSARDRDIEFLKAGKRNYRADALVAISVIVVFAVMIVVIWAPGLSEYAKGALTTILGVFLNQIITVFTFEFGTTKTSRETQDKITTEYLKV